MQWSFVDLVNIESEGGTATSWVVVNGDGIKNGRGDWVVESVRVGRRGVDTRNGSGGGVGASSRDGLKVDGGWVRAVCGF